MYRVLKGRGMTASIVIENTDEKGILNIGRMTREILNILVDEGYTLEELDVMDEWDKPISTETKDRLSELAMRMKKPIRDQSKKAKAPKKANREIDAMDVLLGLASYN